MSAAVHWAQNRRAKTQRPYEQKPATPTEQSDDRATKELDATHHAQLLSHLVSGRRIGILLEAKADSCGARDTTAPTARSAGSTRVQSHCPGDFCCDNLGERGSKVPNRVRSSRDVIVRTPDWSAAREFYGEVLGLTVTNESSSMLRVETGHFRLFVESGTPHGPVFDFIVADVQAAKAKLLAAGCVLLEEDPSIPRCYIQDPFGLVFNLGLSATPE
jgi:predicted enzyme related to lactoylglutathione lyase